MNFKLYKLLNIDSDGVHSIGIFKIISSCELDKKYFAMYFRDDMKASLYDINKDDIVDMASSLYFIFSRYVVDNPTVVFTEPEDALFNVFRLLYKNDINFKTKKENGGKRHGS